MKLTWYPKHLVIAVMLVAAVTAALNLAIDFRRGAVAGILALIAYVVVETILTFNPAQWWGNRRSDT